MPSFDEPILRIARCVADIKRGRKSVEEKAEAIERFVTNFSLGNRAGGDRAAKHVLLPPISRIRASLEAPSIPSRAERTAAPGAKAEAARPPEPEIEPQKIIHIEPPIIVKELATQLGLKPHQLIAELMTFNIFANINQTIEPDIASKICENHGFILEKERREKGAGVHKIEQVVVAPPKPDAAQSMEVQSARSAAISLDVEAAVTSLDEVMHKLHTDTIRFLLTADRVAPTLREYDLDWSPAVLMLCKAFEKETNVRLLLPLREKTFGRNLKADLSDDDLGKIARFCSAAGQPPALGTLGHFLNTAIHSKQRRASSILLQSFYELVSDWPRSQWLVDEFGLEAALRRLANEFRNPAAHIEKLSENEFGKCRTFVREAPEMVLLKLFIATSR